MQLQVDYDATASMQDMLAQLTVNDIILFSVQSLLTSIEYVFEKRACIDQTFFASSSFIKSNENLDQQIFNFDVSTSVFLSKVSRKAIDC